MHKDRVAMGEMTDTAVAMEGVTKRFGRVVALDGVDLEVPAGTVFGLLGPNGAGKTTAVRILTTVITPDRGRARVLGLDVVKEANAVRACIGLAGQYAAVDENLTGMENLRLIGRLTHLDRRHQVARAGELLERFDLVDAADRPVRTYSGGMRRRLDLAAALVHRPPVLFLDEPTTGLDPRSRVELWKLIRELIAEGMTLLLTTQYLEEADRLTDHISVIDGGRVIAEGTAAELKASLGSTAVDIGLADDAEAAKAEVVLSRSDATTLKREGSSVRLEAGDGARALMQALSALDREDITPVSVALRGPSLDDVFFALTGHPADQAQAQAQARTDGEETAPTGGGP